MTVKFKKPERMTFDLYATMDAIAILEQCLSANSLPAPIRRMLYHARERFDEEIDAYFRPGSIRPV